MTRHYATWLWVFNNFLTGSAYVYVAFVMARGHWEYTARYAGFFVALLATSGIHHIIHALPGVVAHLPHELVGGMQITIDVTMTSVAVVTAGLIVIEQWKDHAQHSLR